MPSTLIAQSDRKVIDDANIAAPTYYYNVVIENGETTSDYFKLASANVVGIIFPAAFDGATLTVEVSTGGQSPTWHTLTGVSLTVTADEALELSTTTIFGWPWVRFVSASSETAERTLKVIVKEL